MTEIQVGVVDDEALIAQAHGAYVRRMPGFALAGTAHSGAETSALIRRVPVDLLLLDFNLPDVHGLQLCRVLRASGWAGDVLAVTSSRDLAAVRSAVTLGVVQYLLKPFTFRAFSEKLTRYQEYRDQVSSAEVSSQDGIDKAFAALRGSPSPAGVPGLNAGTLEAVSAALHTGPGRSAAEVARDCGLSRVTARRYLEHLADAGVLRRNARYGSPGRPEVEYVLVARGFGGSEAQKKVQ